MPIARDKARAIASASVPTIRTPSCRAQACSSRSRQSAISIASATASVRAPSSCASGRAARPCTSACSRAAGAGSALPSPSCAPVLPTDASRAHANSVRSRSSSSSGAPSPSMKKSPSSRHATGSPDWSVCTVTATSFPPGVLTAPRRIPMAPPSNPWPRRGTESTGGLSEDSVPYHVAALSPQMACFQRSVPYHTGVVRYGASIRCFSGLGTP